MYHRHGHQATAITVKANPVATEGIRIALVGNAAITVSMDAACNSGMGSGNGAGIIESR
jgi:hypothetical protein